MVYDCSSFRLIGVEVAAILLLTSCVTYSPSTRDYPSHWPAQTNKHLDGTCPIIAGTYTNEFDDFVAGKHYMFFPDGWYLIAVLFTADGERPLLGYGELPQASHVRISQPSNDVLEIVAIQRAVDGVDTVVLRKVLSKRKGDFFCDLDGLKIGLKVESHYAPVALGLEWATYWGYRVFTTSVDDRLVMQEVLKETLWVLYAPAPMGRAEYRWIKWSRTRD